MSELAERFKAWRSRLSVAEAYRRLEQSPEGQLVIRDMLKKSGVLEVSHEPGDPCHTAFREGRRSMGLEILEVLRWSEGELVKLAQEQTSERLAMGEQNQEAA